MKSLIVEDDKTSSVLLQRLLAPFGACDSAEDEVEALILHRIACLDKDPYELICLDLNLPTLDGLTVLKKIREYEDKVGTPKQDRAKVIIVTSVNDSSFVRQAIRLHSDNYLLKPIDRNKLLEHIKNFGLPK